MTPEKMKARSAEKVRQVVDLMKSLHLRTEAREKMDAGGFIEKIVFWIDDEKYQAPEDAGGSSTGGNAGVPSPFPMPTAPTGALAEHV